MSDTLHRRLGGETRALPPPSTLQTLFARRPTCPRRLHGCRRLDQAPARPARELSMQAVIGRSCASRPPVWARRLYLTAGSSPKTSGVTGVVSVHPHRL